MPRPEKVEEVRQITERFRDADAALLTEYRGLRVSEIAEVRGALREVGADYKVLKNTLARIAVRDVGLEDLVALLEGPTAIAFVHGDAAAAAKALDEAGRRFPVLTIKGGVLQGRVIDAAGARRLATLESREVLLAKIAMLMNSPAQQTVNVFSALLRNLGSMLAQVLDKKESGELPSAAGPATTSEAVGEAADRAGAETPDAPVADTPDAPAAADVVAPQPDEAAAETPAPEAAGAGEAPAEAASVPEAEEQAAAAPESEAAAGSTPEETAEEQAAEAPTQTKE